MSRKNIYAMLQTPWMVMTWALTGGGVFLIVVQCLMEGFILLILATILMLVWVTRINPRASLVDVKEEVKRKHKHPAYREEKGG